MLPTSTSRDRQPTDSRWRCLSVIYRLLFFFQAEDGIRDIGVTGVQTCALPIFVELIAKPNARIRYSTIQNWSHNTYNLVTKRAAAYENATVEWVDGNLGSKLTMKYPAVYLMGEGARGEILSVAYAGDGQHQDAGGMVVHAAPNTSSRITSKSISKGTGRSTYRGLLKVYEGARSEERRVECEIGRASCRERV